MTLDSVEIDGLRVGLAATAFAFGLRHGVDWDHLAAITDVTGMQASPRRAMGLATLYAVGHGVVVLALGTAAIFGVHLLPPGADAVMERLIGASLVALAVIVVWSLIHIGEDFRMRSRWMVLAAGAARVGRWTRGRLVEISHEHDHDAGHGHGHEHPHAPGPDDAPVDAEGAVQLTTRHRHLHHHVATTPEDPFPTTSRRAAVALGALHGIGAETPTQVLLFVTAAQVADRLGALALLGLFLAGVFVSNTAIAATASYGYLNANRNFRVYASVAVANAGFSLIVGMLLLLGRGALLPAILGG